MAVLRNKENQGDIIQLAEMEFYDQ